MASASTSYGFGKGGYAYDVFINARGADVNKGLARHLYHSLSRHGLRVFLDIKELQRGEEIITQIKGAIMTASVHVAIFSPTYAQSSWCLDELVQILETGKTIIPVFYNVEPSELRWVRSGNGVYAQDLRNLEMKTTSDSQPRYDFDTLEKWRQALSAVAEIRGFELKAYNGDEGQLVDDVVKQVLTKVPKLPLFVAEYPTGLDNKVENFERTVLSQQKSEKTIVAGIVGIGGVGKTTLAKELFNRHRSKYDGSCFVSVVGETAARGSLLGLQRILLKDLAQLDVHISNIYEGIEMLRRHLSHSPPLLVVIDGVDHIDQLEVLVSPIQDTVHSSSLILVTSRDKGLLQTSGILDSFIYKQTCLNQQHSQELFCNYAFHQPYPPTGFEQMVIQYLDVCGGLPLSLKVIGMHLSGQYDLHYWDAQLRMMSKLLPRDILSILEISYDSLVAEEKRIFLDAACFLIGEERDTAIRIWEGSRWQGLLGLQNLEKKSLLEVDSENRIRMHVQLQKMGRYIAEDVTPHRLWRSDHILTNHSSVRGISMVHGTDPEESFEIPTDIRGLQLLRADGTSVERIFSNAESPQLVWLSWYSCPFSSLPSWISVKNLRVLHIEGKILETLWQDQSQAPLELRELDIDANILNVPKSIGTLKYLEKFVLRRRKNCDVNTVDLETLPGEICGMHSVKHLELVGCKNITLLPDSVGKWTNLQLLVLGGCSALQGLPYSAGKWTRLRRIDLGGCAALQGLPDSAGNWMSLQQIDLGGCSSLWGLPDSAGNWMSLQRIDLGGCSALQGLPESAGNWMSLQQIDLGGCSALQELPDSAENWTSLQWIDLGGCSGLQGLPESAGKWMSLQRIDLGGCTALQGLPDSAGNWRNLEVIDLRECSALQGLPDSAGKWMSLQRIDLGGCSALQGLPESAGKWMSLQQIDLGGCSALHGLPESAGHWRSLQQIDLGGCSALHGLPESAGYWRSLEQINLGGCSALQGLPESAGLWRSLQQIDLGGCSALRELPESAENWTSLQWIDLGGCSSLCGLPESAGNWKSLQRIDLGGCSALQGLPESAGKWMSLQRIDLGGCTALQGLSDSAGNWTSLQWIDLGGFSALQWLPDSAGNWTNLEVIDLRKCSALQGLPDSAGNWMSLQRIDLGGCSALQGLPESAGNWMSLQQIDLGGCSSLCALPDSAGNWKSLQRIDLGGCSALQGLPESAGNWISLQRIDLGGCTALQWLPDSAGNWTSLQWIDLGGCSALQWLPDSAGNWTNLEVIDLRECSALQGLPDSAGNWTSLQRIDLGGCSALQRLPDSASNWTSLKCIDLGGCSALKGLAYLKGLPDSKGNYTNLEYSLLEDMEESRALLHASSASAASTSISNYSSASASASAASTSISNYVYDVFINCHGPDVKRTFANHLYHRLVSYGLRPFVDEERHEEDNIGTQIKEAIATASVHVPIFCLRYAESRRFLLMLASGAPVIPVFYTVKRSDLQWTKDKDGVYAGVLGRTLQNHEKGTTYESQASGEKPRDMSNMIEEWREALYRISVPEISGFELEAFKDDEAELLDAVVKSVLKSVRKAPFYEVKYLKDLDQKVEDFENTVLLHRQSGKPQVVGIVGVAGVGKTTLAKELINRKSSSFNRTCFLFDVSGTVARSSLHFLQSKLFKDLTNLNIQIESVTQGIELFTEHFSSSHGATAFVILDNVDDVHQLQALLPVQTLLPSKSLIVITSRMEDVLIHSGVEQSLIYSLTDLPLDKHPSGLDRKVKALTKILQQQSEEPQVLGIVGKGGIGKTRLAMEFFNRKSSDYTRSYFLYDVNETARTSFTLQNLQSKLLQGLTQLDLQVQVVDEGIELFKEHVSYFRSLVILDNVDHWDQLHALLSVLTVLPSGSLILVTCREEDVLKRSGVQESSIYKLHPLNKEDSLELFCTCAFGQTSPGHEFEDLAEKFVRACKGLPLTLKVFGALLRGKSNSYWQTLFDKFHRIPPDQIQRSLQLCYDELDEEEQNIFLHIACSCIGAKRDFAIRLWDASGSRGGSVFESLQKRCLVDVDREDCIIMHELLIELGRTNADEKGLRRPPRPRRGKDSDLFPP